MRINGLSVAQIAGGFLVLLGATHGDTPATARAMAAKVASLRIFADQTGRMNLGLAEVGGSLLCVSQFTLYAEVRTGRRPSFEGAADAEVAQPLYEEFCRAIEEAGVPCRRGLFGAQMEVSLINDGPVTLIVDSEDLRKPRRA